MAVVQIISAAVTDGFVEVAAPGSFVTSAGLLSSSGLVPNAWALLISDPWGWEIAAVELGAAIERATDDAAADSHQYDEAHG